MLKDSLLLLDMDEHLRETHERRSSLQLEICKETGTIFDLATSDVVLYLEQCTLETAKRIAETYNPVAKYREEGKNSFAIY